MAAPGTGNSICEGLTACLNCINSIRVDSDHVGPGDYMLGGPSLMKMVKIYNIQLNIKAKIYLE